MGGEEKAFTIRLRGAVLDRLLREAEEAGDRPTPFIERLVASSLQDEAGLKVLDEVQALRTELQDDLDRRFRALRNDIITTTEAILCELRRATSNHAVSDEQKRKWEEKVRTWTEALRKRA